MHQSDTMFVLKAVGAEVRESDRYEVVYSIIAFCLYNSILLNKVNCHSSQFNIKFTNEFLINK
jgi:hypothetical protein